MLSLEVICTHPERDATFVHPQGASGILGTPLKQEFSLWILTKGTGN